jgi:hypothetical protein
MNPSETRSINRIYTAQFKGSQYETLSELEYNLNKIMSSASSRMFLACKSQYEKSGLPFQNEPRTCQKKIGYVNWVSTRITMQFIIKSQSRIAIRKLISGTNPNTQNRYWGFKYFDVKRKTEMIRITSAALNFEPLFILKRRTK